MQQAVSMRFNSGPVGNYSVEGTYSYHQIASGEVDVNDGSTEDVIANSDASMDDLKGKNLAGVRATLTFTDDETQAGPGVYQLFPQTMM